MRESEPTSPCTGICTINPVRDLCRGCLRTLDEIAAWSSASAARKRAILAEVARRQSESVRSI
ncbi:MAG: DUF1289 domain-containing protein [Novosphingobium sp.]|nr:DUF1289 domain-containing protein [Novosphingobium sp.]MDP3550411.1 DUF1289 domain-containing protein [Novosphingobium sp.]